jgi:hypothetical protein
VWHVFRANIGHTSFQERPFSFVCKCYQPSYESSTQFYNHSLHVWPGTQPPDVARAVAMPRRCPDCSALDLFGNLWTSDARGPAKCSVNYFCKDSHDLPLVVGNQDERMKHVVVRHKKNGRKCEFNATNSKDLGFCLSTSPPPPITGEIVLS